MITLIILTVLTTIGIYIAIKSYDFDILGVVMALVCVFWILIHSLVFFTQGYYYGLFVEKRQAFEQTLNNARENGNDYETAAIVKEVAIWNVSLAEKKYDNKNWYLGQFEDDRIEDLEPIE